MAGPVLDAVQVLDQQVAAARRRPQQLPDCIERLGIDPAALRCSARLLHVAIIRQSGVAFS
jgi:hypothetical protein